MHILTLTNTATGHVFKPDVFEGNLNTADLIDVCDQWVNKWDIENFTVAEFWNGNTRYEFTSNGAVYSLHAQATAENPQSGQGIVEYAIVLVLISIVVIVVLALIGPKLEAMLKHSVSPSGVQQPAILSPQVGNPESYENTINLYMDTCFLDDNTFEECAESLNLIIPVQNGQAAYNMRDEYLNTCLEDNRYGAANCRTAVSNVIFAIRYVH